TSQVVTVNNKIYLIDCGEGTQIQLRNLNFKASKIDHIFISHLHGDHFFGLVGLISTFHLLKREKPLNIYGPDGLEEIIYVQLKYSNTKLCYELNFHTIEEYNGQIIFENKDLTIETVAMKHRIPCAGFVIREKERPRKILQEKIEEYHLPIEVMSDIKDGQDYTNEKGQVIPNDELTTDPPPPRSYAYCTDTAYNEEIITAIKGVDLLYHEATFGEDSADRAATTFHSTAKQAAAIAQKAEAGKLLIGHFSAKYKTLEILLEEAKSVFPNTELALEGTTFSI
ncbi:MAG: ribonuclease Z, partial [Bacteroidetes bacterium]|nr:ribonuclease Z [Bacteroidota bacterium]